MKKVKERQRKVLLILKKFRKSKIEKLDKYLKSDFFSNNKRCVSLFEILQSHHPKFSKLNNELMISHLFSNQAEKKLDLENELNDVFSSLYKKVLNFIALENFLKNKDAQDDAIIEYFQESQSYTQLEKASLTKLKILNKQPFRNSDFYSQKVKVLDRIYFHPDSNKFKNNKKRKSNLTKEENFDVIPSLKNAEINFVLTRLRHALELYQRARIFNLPVPEVPLLDEVIKLAEKESFYQNPIIEIYVSLIHLVKTEGHVIDFENLIQLFSTHTHLVDLTERREILQFFLNQVNYTHRLGIEKTAKQQLENQVKLYKIGMEKNCLVVFNQISDIVFTNIIVIFSQNDAFDFAEKFISKYEKFLHPDLKHEAIRFSWACIFYYKKQYLKAIELFSKKTKFTQLYLEHRAKILLLCCKYELYLKNILPIEKDQEQFDVMYDAINSFERYYQRKSELASNKIQPYLNFVRILRKIFETENISKNDRQDRKLEIIHYLQSLKVVSAKKWLLTHIDKL